ncbi:MAG: hypothetical protein Q4A17_04045 [Thermoguttaceae bacterium]|nr:hypothetical protein [Thermoguttaceae bacterium]
MAIKPVPQTVVAKITKKWKTRNNDVRIFLLKILEVIKIKDIYKYIIHEKKDLTEKKIGFFKNFRVFSGKSPPKPQNFVCLS